MKISNRILNMPESPVRKMDTIATKIKESGINIHHLNIGDPDIKTPEIFFKAIKEYDTQILGYAKSEGVSDLVHSLQKYYKKFNLDFDYEDILVTAGGSEALQLILMSVCDYHEEILVFEPFYTNYNGFADVCDVKTVAVTTHSKNGFHLPSKEEIISKITPKTRAILFSNPGNPTGTVYTRDEIEMLADIAIEEDLYIISDEVYREFVYDGLESISSASIDRIKDRVIIVDSISKRYSACGARIGCLASKNKELMNQVLKICQNRLCVPTLDQIGAKALYDAGQSFLNEVKAEYDSRRNLIYNELAGTNGISFIKPDGAFYLILDLPIKDAEHFVTWLLTEFSIDNETVMLAPAQGFYSTKGLGKNQVRIAYILDCDKLKRAAKIIKLGLKEYMKKYE
ncbi:aspartate aminotransferase [Bacilli bacterium PM5-3]|nr:aspartate aminotransferase [Bacilli bacterium PM5-3]